MDTAEIVVGAISVSVCLLWVAVSAVAFCLVLWKAPGSLDREEDARAPPESTNLGNDLTQEQLDPLAGDVRSRNGPISFCVCGPVTRAPPESTNLGNELTQEQRDLMPVYFDKWMRLGFSTEPIPEEKARSIVATYLRTVLGRERPVVLKSSPASCWAEIGGRTDLDDSAVSPLDGCLKEIWKRVPGHIRHQITARCPQDGALVMEQIAQGAGDLGVIWLYGRGRWSWPWSAILDYCSSVLRIPVDARGHEKCKAYQATVALGTIYPLNDVCIAGSHPSVLHLHEGRLHHDGGKAIEWSDGWGLWSLHGVTVPQWLAETASEKIDPHRILEIENSQVRAEFARKVGLERMWYTLKGRVIEARTVTLKTPGNPAWECAYKLVELDFGNGERPRALVMPNASLPDVMHVEYVPGTCQTVYQAINFRLGRKPEDVREDGEPYWLHGDVILRPKGATSWRPWPELIA